MAASAEERTSAQVKQNFDRINTATSEATNALKESYSTALKGAQQYTAKIFEFAQANSNSVFDYARKLTTAKSPVEFVELSNDHLRQQAGALSQQAQELTEMTQRMTSQTTESLRTGAEKAAR